MILKTYNGYHHSQRMRALNWLKAEYPVPIRCQLSTFCSPLPRAKYLILLIWKGGRVV